MLLYLFKNYYWYSLRKKKKIIIGDTPPLQRLLETGSNYHFYFNKGKIVRNYPIKTLFFFKKKETLYQDYFTKYLIGGKNFRKHYQNLNFLTMVIYSLRIPLVFDFGTTLRTIDLGLRDLVA